MPQQKRVAISANKMGSASGVAGSGATQQHTLDPRTAFLQKSVQLTIDSYCNVYHCEPQVGGEVQARRLAAGRVRHATTQSSDTATSRECQTDTIETYSLGIQVPSDETGIKSGQANASSSVNSVNLLRFLAQAESVLDVLIGENRTLAQHSGNSAADADASVQTLANSQRTASNLTALASAQSVYSAATLAHLPWLKDRPIQCAAFNEQQSQQICIVFGAQTAPESSVASTATTSDDDWLRHKCLLVVFDLQSDSQQPLSCCYAQSDVSCVRFARHFLFAGSACGSIALFHLNGVHAQQSRRCFGVRFSPHAWSCDGQIETDVIRQANSPKRNRIKHNRRMSTSTINDWRAVCHAGRIVQLTLLSGAGAQDHSLSCAGQGLSDLLSGNASNSGRLSLASLDEYGMLCVWQLQSAQPDAPLDEAYVDQTFDQLATYIGSSVQLVKTSVVRLSDASVAASPGVDASASRNGVCALAFSPTHAENEYLLSTQSKGLQRRTPDSRNEAQRYALSAEDQESSSLSQTMQDVCLSCAFSPFVPHLFAACFSSGRIAVYSLRANLPLCVLQSSEDLVQLNSVEWSSTRPTVLYASSSTTGAVCVCDLQQSKQNTVHSVQLQNQPTSLHSLAMSRVLPGSALAQSDGSAVEGQSQQLAFIASDQSSLTVLQFNREWQQAKPKEVDWLRDFALQLH